MFGTYLIVEGIIDNHIHHAPNVGGHCLAASLAVRKNLFDALCHTTAMQKMAQGCPGDGLTAGFAPAQARFGNAQLVITTDRRQHPSRQGIDTLHSPLHLGGKILREDGNAAGPRKTDGKDMFSHRYKRKGEVSFTIPLPCYRGLCDYCILAISSSNTFLNFS